MSVQIEEFVNPKSMLTPGGATAIVALLSGILFAATGVHIHILLAAFSLFFAAVVFFSKEFADPAMSRPAKVFFYLINALIIFAMSTGTHATFDRRPQQSTSTHPQSLTLEHDSFPTRSLADWLIGSAHAQSNVASPPVLTQERPVFFDWTKQDPMWTAFQPPQQSVFLVHKTDKASAFRRALEDAGLMTPNVYVALGLDMTKLPAGAQVKAVQWNLPQAYFETNTKVSADASTNFGLGIKAWKSFPVQATVELSTGEKLRYFDVVEIGKLPPEKK